MRFLKVYLAFVGATLGPAIFAGEPPVKIEHAWVRAVPPSATDSVAYMTVLNTSDQPLRLTGGSTPIAETAMLMASTKRSVNGQELVGMKGIEELTIPAHDRLILAPEGDHLMLMGLKEHPKPGDKVKLTLRFGAAGQDVTVECPVAMTSP
jgi:copper(I)-binding protein